MSQKQKKEDCCFSWFFFQMYWIFRAVTPNFILSTYIQGNLLAFYILLAHYERITPLPDSFFPKRQPKPAKSGRRVQMFSRKQLIKLILPLVVEQFLAMTIGIADTLMVATCGEAAESGISLVDSINILLINIFSALANRRCHCLLPIYWQRTAGKRTESCQAIGSNHGDFICGNYDCLFAIPKGTTPCAVWLNRRCCYGQCGDLFVLISSFLSVYCRL